VGRSVFRAAVVVSLVTFTLGAHGAAQSLPTTGASQTAWTLDAALTAALSQHPLVEAARSEVVAAEGSRRTAALTPNPIATYWVENARFPGPATASAVERETSAYATLPLEPFFQRGSRVVRADADVRVAQASVTVAERRVAIDLVHAFYRMAVAQASVDAARENQEALEQLVDYLRNRVAQGATPEAELIRAEVERDRGEAESALAGVEVLRAASGLRPFLPDRAAQDQVRVVAPASASAASLPPMADLTAHAMATRPELLVSRAKVQSASGAVALERALMIREIGASFGVKRTLGVNAMVAGLSVTLPLFDRNRGEIQRATAQRLGAELESRWLERAVVSEVEAEYQAVRTLAPRVAAMQPSFVGRAEESRRIALAAYQEGATSLLQVLDTARVVTDVKLTFARIAATAGESAFNLGIVAGYDPRTAAGFAGGAPLPSGQLPSNGGAR